MSEVTSTVHWAELGEQGVEDLEPIRYVHRGSRMTTSGGHQHPFGRISNITDGEVAPLWRDQGCSLDSNTGA